MSKRLYILSDPEIKNLYAIPCFNHEEREYYFTLEPQEKAYISAISTNNTKIYFVLMLGYFKAKQQFFNLKADNINYNDLSYIQQQYFQQCNNFKISISLSKPTRFQLQTHILKLMDYQTCSTEVKSFLSKLLTTKVSVDRRPLFLFKELLTYLQKNRIILPGYSYIQDIISQVIMAEEKRLTELIEHQLSNEDKQGLYKLLEAESNIYKLTYLKQEPRNFSLRQISEEIKKLQQLSALYTIAKRILPRLTISAAAISYYASLVDYYSIYKLQRFKNNKICVYLVCFVYHRYHKVNDNLIESFIHYVNRYNTLAYQAGQEIVIQYQLTHNKQLKQAAKILNLFTTDHWDESTFGEVKTHAYNILPLENFKGLIGYLNKQRIDPLLHEWNYFHKISRVFKLYLRPLALNLNFLGTLSVEDLTNKIKFLQENLNKGKNLQEINPNKFPLGNLPISLNIYLYDSDIKDPKKKRLNVNKYEYMVYKQVLENLKSGNIFIKESHKYRSFEDDLVDKEIFKNKEDIFKDLGLKRILTPTRTLLSELEEELEDWVARTNANIKNNPYIKRSGKKWSLPYPTVEEIENHTIYYQIPQINIADLLMDNHDYCQFLNQFTHITDRYQKNKVDNKLLIACIIALGTYLGLGKMGEISDVNYHILNSTTQNFIRLETLRKANDEISNTIASLPIFKHYSILEDIIHASSDGSKIETQISTFNSRYSSKYFGFKKGVSAVSMVANYIPINAKIIGAHEHESHYVYDLLANNTSKIDPDILSTDTHGTNQVNFAILFLSDYLYAPHFKDTADKINSIYGFKLL